MTQPLIAVFGSSQVVPGEGDYEDGLTCGTLLAEAGYGVATGGYAGVMEAVSRGARQAGARVLGITAPAVFPDRPGANEFVSEELPAAHLLERIHEITRVSAAAIALPGSLGTLTELVAAWNLGYVARFSGEIPKPLITVGDRWARIIAELAEILETDGGLVGCVPDVTSAVAEIRRLVPL